MAFWEFLIQKEGDRSWLPLESPKVEILEGRYRIVARSSRINAPVEIRMVQNAITETPPVRRIQKRTSQTNKDGLIVIIPFTRLLPGAWELRCTGDLMAEMLGDGWQHSVQLQVLPLELTSDDWDADWQPDSMASEPASLDQTRQNLTGSDQTGQDTADQTGTTDSLTIIDAAEPALEVITPAIAQPDFDRLTATAAQAPKLLLTLERQTYVVLREQPLVLNGQVLNEPLPSERPEDPPEDSPFPGGHLRLRLFDPQTSRMLTDQTQALSEQSMPLPFSLTVALPPNCETHLLLGELALYGMASEGSLPAVLASQSFSVTTDLLELLETLANDFLADSLPEQKPVSSATTSTVLTLPRTAPPIQFRPVMQQSLPPLLRPSGTPGASKDRRSLDLPTFSSSAADGSATAIEAEAIKSNAETEAALDAEANIVDHTSVDNALAKISNLEDPDLLLQPIDTYLAHPQSIDIPELTDISEITDTSLSPELAAASRVDGPDLPNPPHTELPSTELPNTELPELDTAEAPRDGNTLAVERSLHRQTDEFIDPSVDWENVERQPLLWQQKATVPEATSVSTPEDSAFKALNLQDRFLERLQALALDTELAEWLHTLDMPNPASGDSSEDESPDLASDVTDPPMELSGIFAKHSRVKAIGRDADLAAQEIVVEDEPLAKQSSGATSSLEITPASQPAPVSEVAIAPSLSSLTTVLEEEPMPTPQLEVPTGELTAGQTVHITVKLQDTYARVYAKLWTHDRQSRTLLDGPHWLMDFSPDGLGHVISKTQIMVPFGCVEVQFERSRLRW
ncbi:MAG: hypothetical protein HC772_07095 [Leptolyngbyaceae cyanobacterium CRU_2_3]|nr:hypothetical protein [Leptolyngbyaceae cyanobacterium CRU_2_3]